MLARKSVVGVAVRPIAVHDSFDIDRVTFFRSHFDCA